MTQVTGRELGALESGPEVFPCVGLYPAGLQDLCLHSFKTKERTLSQQHRHQWFKGWGSLHVRNNSWSDTPPCAVDSGQNMVAVFAPGVGVGGDYQL